MDVDRCVVCGEPVPEGRQICLNCEYRVDKIGSILQSQNATKDDVVKAYEFINNKTWYETGDCYSPSEIQYITEET